MKAGTTTLCSHCGTPFHSSPNRPEFCCAGCQFVSHLLHKRGLEEFYRYGDGLLPAGNSVFHERDLSWLEDVRTNAEASGGETASASLDIQGISCAGCVWLLERLFLDRPGAVSCRVNSSTGSLRLTWIPGQCDLRSWVADVHKFGYILGPAEKKPPSRPLARRLGLCAALALNAMLFALPRYLGLLPGDELARLFDAISLGIATASMVLGGGYFFRRAATALRAGSLHIDLPISIGLLVAYTGSCIAWAHGTTSFAYLDFISIFTFLMLLGRWLQERAVDANRQRLLALRLGPGNVRIGDAQVSAESIQPDDRFSIGKGALVPVRARLLSGPTLFALSGITGEPAPREFLPGSPVPSGARCLAEAGADFEAMETWASSRLASLLNVSSGMTWRNAAMQRLISLYLGIVLVLGAAGFAAWWVVGGDLLMATQVLVSVLVVSCPCAIGVALPLLDDLAAARLQKSGIFIRDGSLWQRLRHVSTLLLDKTGTLTLETLALSNPTAPDGLSPDEKSALLRLVQSSLHPVAACLREFLLPRGIEPLPGGSSVSEVPGSGLEWSSPQGSWRLGRPAWAGSASSSRTAFTLDGRLLAGFDFHEALRPGATREISRLQDMGLDIFLLSGDASPRVRRLASTLGLPPDHAFGELSPEEKAGLIHKRWNQCSLMVGDGANDSLAFDAALCRGTPAVDTGLLEHKADFYMPQTNLGGLEDLFRASARHHRTSRAVFAFAIAYNTLAVSAALSGCMNPLVAAIIMPLSSLASTAIVFLGFSKIKT